MNHHIVQEAGFRYCFLSCSSAADTAVATGTIVPARWTAVAGIQVVFVGGVVAVAVLVADFVFVVLTVTF